jgi:hypothetical protein
MLGHECNDKSPRIQEFKRRKAEAERLEEEAWQKCDTPAERACADVDRFMQHYFYTNGTVDPTKTTEPLVLDGYPYQGDIRRRAEQIPGLKTCLGGQDGQWTVCIGWDHDTVRHLADTLSSRYQDEEIEKQEVGWNEDMEEHHAFVAGLKKKKQGKLRPAVITNREKLDKCKGTYIVRCDQVSDNWDNCDSLGVDIDTGPKPGILQAAVEFGIIEGTMLMAFNEAELEACLVTTRHGKSGHVGCSDGNRSSEDNAVISGPTSKKRKQAAKSQTPRKHAKTAAATNNRLFFRFKGRETSGGCIFYNPHKGYIEFTDSDCVAFKGVGSMPAVGNKVLFEGFKTDARASTQAEPWSSFSEAVYEEENESRWH